MSKIKQEAITYNADSARIGWNHGLSDFDAFTALRELAKQFPNDATEYFAAYRQAKSNYVCARWSVELAETDGSNGMNRRLSKTAMTTAMRLYDLKAPNSSNGETRTDEQNRTRNKFGKQFLRLWEDTGLVNPAITGTPDTPEQISAAKEARKLQREQDKEEALERDVQTRAIALIKSRDIDTKVLTPKVSNQKSARVQDQYIAALMLAQREQNGRFIDTDVMETYLVCEAKIAAHKSKSTKVKAK